MNEIWCEGLKLSYDEAGSGAPALLFVHGWCCDHTYFAPQFEHFQSRHVNSWDFRPAAVPWQLAKVLVAFAL